MLKHIGLSVKSALCLLAIVAFVVCTVFLLQCMLPAVDDRDDLIEIGSGMPVMPTTTMPVASRVNMTAGKLTGGRLVVVDVVDITKVDMLAMMLPATLSLIAKSDVQVEGKRKEIMGHVMFYREAFPPSKNDSTARQNILLLHGLQMSSQTWQELGTISLMAAAGYRVVAVDLQGYGLSLGGLKIPVYKRGDYLNRVVIKLGLNSRLVIVSPSMSGSYSLPLLFDNPEQISGLVPVAPVATDKYTAEQYADIKIPTLIIYGDNDTQLGKLSADNLRHLPNSQVQKLPNAKHAAYLDQPELFHQLLYNFMLALNTADPRTL